MKFRHPVENYVIICLFAVASLLAAYGIISAVDSGVSPSPKPLSVSSAASCTFPEKSFCSTEQTFIRLVNDKDFSGILENQVPTDTPCSGAVRSQPYCKGVKDGLIVQLFQVRTGNVSKMLTRNEYISFFNSYFQQNGPFHLASKTAAKSDISMAYTNRTGSKDYTLTFSGTKSGWKLIYPTAD